VVGALGIAQVMNTTPITQMKVSSMSRVTSAIILIDHIKDVSILLGNVVEGTGVTPQMFTVLDDHDISEQSGGYKHLEFSHMLAAGFNYVSPEALDAWFQNLKWDVNDEAIMIMNCNGEGFQVSRRDV